MAALCVRLASGKHNVGYHVRAHMAVEQADEPPARHHEVGTHGGRGEPHEERLVAYVYLRCPFGHELAGHLAPRLHQAVLVERCLQPRLAHEAQQDIAELFGLSAFHDMML